MDSIDISNHFQSLSQGRVFICQNSTLIFKGNQSSTNPTFYVSAGAKLILKDAYFYPNVYLGNMAELDARGGSQSIVLYRMASSILTDTANCNFVLDSISNTVNFTFTNWPNASNPCNTIPAGLNDMSLLRGNILVQQKEVRIKNDKSSPMTARLMNMQGQVLRENNIVGEEVMNLYAFPDGIYIIQLERDSERVSQKIHLR